MTTTTIAHEPLPVTQAKHIWLRDEVKPNEQRTALTPHCVQQLIQAGFQVTVERSKTRIFPDDQYEQIEGVQLVPSNHWIDNAPNAQSLPHTLVVGLKELATRKQEPYLLLNNEEAEEEDDNNKMFSIAQRHVLFAHCYKGQSNWRENIDRFASVNGEILDLEFLNWDNGRRVAAFGVAAGYAGMAVGLIVWARQQLALKNGTAMSVEKLHPYLQKEDLISEIRSLLDQVGRIPKVLVIGALGRCGKGSIDLAESVGVSGDDNLVKWDMEETKRGGPFPELLDVDILVNDIYLMGKIAPFLTKQMIDEAPQRRLTVFVDVSCDVGNPNNPLNLIDDITTFDVPSRRIVEANESTQPLDVIAIDHLPSLTPKESSIDFCSQLLEHILNLKDVDFSLPVTESSGSDLNEGTEAQRVWTRARALYVKKVNESKN